MKNCKKIIAVAFVIALATVAVSAQSALRVGDAAPAFTMTTLEGKTVTLADYKKKAVLLHFWATWCPPCRAELPEMNKLAEKLAKESNGELEFLAVAVSDTPSAVSTYMSRNKYTFNGGLDTTNQLSAAYNVQAVPTSVLIGADGKIERIQIGAMTKAKLSEFVSKYVK